MLLTQDILLIIHFAGLMMGAGGGLGSTVAAGYAAKLPPEQASVVRGLAPALARLSTVGLVLMLVTGFGLTAVKYGGFSGMPAMFWAKMVFVAMLTIAALLIEMTHAQVKAGNVAVAARLPRLGPVAGLSAFLAMILAALTFH